MRSLQLQTCFCSVAFVTYLGVLYLTAVHLGGPDWSVAPLDTLKLTSPDGGDHKLPAISGRISATVSYTTVENKGNSEASENVLSNKSTLAPLDTLKLTSPNGGDHKLPAISGRKSATVSSITMENKGNSEASENVLSKKSTSAPLDTLKLTSPDEKLPTISGQERIASLSSSIQALPSPVVRSEDEETLSQDHVLHTLATAEPHQPVSVPRQNSEAVTNQRELEYRTPPIDPNQNSSDPVSGQERIASISTEYEGMSGATEDLLLTEVKKSTGNQDNTQALPSPVAGNSKYTKEQKDSPTLSSSRNSDSAKPAPPAPKGKMSSGGSTENPTFQFGTDDDL